MTQEPVSLTERPPTAPWLIAWQEYVVLRHELGQDPPPAGWPSSHGLTPQDDAVAPPDTHPDGIHATGAPM